jgi:hypothetical protein
LQIEAELALTIEAMQDAEITTAAMLRIDEAIEAAAEES